MTNPYKNANQGKKEQLTQMFNKIAENYDFLNHSLSMGIDKSWRKKAINLLNTLQPKMILDVAAGTGDFALESMKLNPDKVIGIDISEKMLAQGRRKIEKRNLSKKVELLEGDSENIQFNDNTFDAVTVAFGVRNFENLEKGLREMHRVVRPKGKVVILEFSKPEKFPIKQVYNLYLFKILPIWGKFVSKEKEAYAYLPQSVKEFPDGEDFLKIYRNCGFTDTKQMKLSCGIVSIYTGTKK